FGATVTYLDGTGEERTIAIVGIDEVVLPRGRVSWLSPIGRPLARARDGATVQVRTPAGGVSLVIVGVRSLPREEGVALWAPLAPAGAVGCLAQGGNAPGACDFKAGAG
ncbi:MAG: GreA/GreB family elongation factor, partial [Betaproteobacteria bacterium]